MLNRAVIVAVSSFVFAVAAPAAHAEWPDHAIHWFVPFGPGGANDLIARVAAEAVSKRLGQPIVIDNRPGAGAIVGTGSLAQGRLPARLPMATPF
jgi:tripartite-type tricarboxylate transporter receptor subunit TctC